MTAEDEFRQLMERYRDMLWHVCTDYSLGQAWEADDALQEVLAVLWVEMPKLKKKECERSWVYKVATNTMLTLCRKQHNRPTDPLPSDLENRMTTEEYDDYDYVMELIGLLDQEDRRIVRARLDGFSFKEIGKDLGISSDAANKRCERALDKIRELYEKKL